MARVLGIINAVIGVKLFGRAVSRDAYFISGLVMRRAVNAVDLMGLLSQPVHMEEADLFFDKGLLGSIENMVVCGEPFFGDLQWRLASLPIQFTSLGFEEVPNREGSITERNTEGNRPSKAGVEKNGRHEMNLPLLWQPTWEGTKMANLNSKEFKKIIIKAPQYKLIIDSLYKKSFYTPWFRCIALPKTDGVIKEIHNGSCGFSTELRLMVVRIINQGYYWPSMHRDVSRIIQNCKKCKDQFAVKKIEEIEAIAAGNAWPFSYWGVSILGPLPMALRGLKFLAISIEHTTKWIEAKPLTTVNARHVERF
uniref:Gypsy retrotransposon integrase-like protein 1 n=1 Tax=Tanacetum cinerariifolium TaxID=118510 RepID=A0A699HP64_TANCI|nr:gypsy retrotransposon integrase-like protein 1 [Tanacetum cinerariifolium]